MEIICYACGRGEYPENTMEAIAHCQKVNKDWRIEVDLQITKDGEIILLHDENLKRVTDLNMNVSEVPIQYIKELNAGYGFKLGHEYPYREKPITIPLLSDVFETFPKVNFLLDVHTNNLKAVTKIIEIIEEKKMSNNTIVVSKFDNIIGEFKQKRKNWIYGAPTKEAKKMVFSSFLLLDWLFPIQSHILMIPITYKNKTLLTSRVINHVRKHKKQVWAWLYEGEEVITVNSKNQFLKLQEMGVHGIFTEYPERLQKEMGGLKI